MSITPPPFQSERRDQPRRSADRAVDDLHITFSTPHCHSCLERMADGVLLLDNETRVIYTTQEVDQVLKRHDLPFALSPKFTLHQPHHASRFAAFVNGKNHETGPLGLLLEGENGRDLLLLNCFQLPKPAEPDLQVARYMITLRDPNHYPSRQWLLFSKQFNLTQAEARLCRTFADGLNLNDYCEKWKVATSTAQPAPHCIRQDLHAPAVRSAAADFFVLPDLMRKFIHHLMDALFRLFPIKSSRLTKRLLFQRFELQC